MRGPALDPTIGRSSEFRSLEFRSIQVKPGSAQNAGILNLDPKSTCANPLGRKAWTTRLLGVDIQMRGPALDPTIGRSSEFRSLEFRSIQVKPGSAQNAGILNLDPKSTYHFRVVSSAGRTVGEPSKQQRIGPGTGLSGAAIAGIAEGIPCSLLALFTFTALLCISYCKNTAPSHGPTVFISTPVLM
ncbi:hypothetical protein NHX12_027673 [Muraenolepis orangiensis]|uniref:Uncharacterized protein n=1 Tax=Muraenolepis orangiensis TaxID=630683 RepID=A0A9Q0EHB9_9TELE|nr:hypothetical protein NHX12_027673 [Muraenolepis orangiensis]